MEKTVHASGTQSTAYVWGHELRQQASGAAGSAHSYPQEALIPLQGHLSTTLAAVNAEGQLIEHYPSTVWWELENTSPKARHQYTGEYWDGEMGFT